MSPSANSDGQPQKYVDQAPPLTRRWIRMMLGLTVGVGVGLAPLLGKIGVPGFAPLLSLFPEGVQGTAIPLSSMFMSLVAVGVQFFDGKRMVPARLQRLFIRSLGAVFILLMALGLVHAFSVVRVPIQGGQDYASFVVGFGERPRSCDETCAPKMSDAECITSGTTLNPARVESCWQTKRVQGASAILLILYLSTMTAFAVVVGLLLMKGGQVAKRK